MGAFPIHKAWGLGAGWELKAALSPCNAGWSSVWISVTGPWHREGAFCTASALPELSPCPANTQLYPHHGWADGERAQLTTSPLGASHCQPFGGYISYDVGCFCLFFERETSERAEKLRYVVFFLGGEGEMLVFFPSSKQLSSYSAIPLCPQRRRNSWSGKKDGRRT